MEIKKKPISEKFKAYSTDGKVTHLSNEDDINNKLGKIIGQKFIDYREKWDSVNRMETITDFPMFLQLDMNQECNYECPHCIIGHKKEVMNIMRGSI